MQLDLLDELLDSDSESVANSTTGLIKRAVDPGGQVSMEFIPRTCANIIDNVGKSQQTKIPPAPCATPLKGSNKIASSPALSLPNSEGAAPVERPLNSEPYRFKRFDSHLELGEAIESSQESINEGSQLPQRISQGSSGSYLVCDGMGQALGIFKPKDEEPYGQLNPKWIKWLHRTCCPCLFGRAFLMPNTGYVSEAGASLVDGFFGLDVVPQTQVAHMKSPSFFYEPLNLWWWRRKPGRKEELPLKLGSLQIFVEGFEESERVLTRLERMRPMPVLLQEAFQREFERMVVLDYIIRNTDRSLDNWLIHLSWEDPSWQNSIRTFSTSIITLFQSVGLYSGSVPETRTLSEGHIQRADEEEIEARNTLPVVKIACIDNGLSFPFRHPSREHEWLSYPYSWAELPEARMPFSPGLRQRLLPILEARENWEALVQRLHQLFQIDAEFDERIFKRQMAVMRGQLYNLTRSFQRHESPMELLRRPMLEIRGSDELPDWSLPNGEDLCGVFEKRHLARSEQSDKKNSIFCF